MDLYLVARGRVLSTPLLLGEVNQPGCGLYRPLLLGRLLDERLCISGKFYPLGLPPRVGHRLDLLAVGLDIHERLLPRHTVGDPLLDEFQLRGGEAESGELPGHDKADGIEGFLIFGFGAIRGECGNGEQGDKNGRMMNLFMIYLSSNMYL